MKLSSVLYILLLHIVTFVSVCQASKIPIPTLAFDRERNDIRTRIIGGVPVSSSSVFPFMTSLYFDTGRGRDLARPFCGGTLIAQNAVLTAAHCAVIWSATNFKSFFVLPNSYDLTKSSLSSTREVIGVVPSAIYNEYGFSNDVAVLLLKPDESGSAPSAFSDFASPMSPEDLSHVDEYRVIGFGVTNVDTRVASTKLMQVDLKALTNQQCTNDYWGRFGISIQDMMMCAGNPTGSLGSKSACNGDSGGPLMVQKGGDSFRQVGVVSWGERRCGEELPSVYAKLNVLGGIAEVAKEMSSHVSDLLKDDSHSNSSKVGATLQMELNLKYDFYSRGEHRTFFKNLIRSEAAKITSEPVEVFAINKISEGSSLNNFRDRATRVKLTIDVLGHSTAASAACSKLSNYLKSGISQDSFLGLGAVDKSSVKMM